MRTRALALLGEVGKETLAVAIRVDPRTKDGFEDRAVAVLYDVRSGTAVLQQSEQPQEGEATPLLRGIVRAWMANAVNANQVDAKRLNPEWPVAARLGRYPDSVVSRGGFVQRVVLALATGQAVRAFDVTYAVEPEPPSFGGDDDWLEPLKLLASFAASAGPCRERALFKGPPRGRPYRCDVPHPHRRDLHPPGPVDGRSPAVRGSRRAVGGPGQRLQRPRARSL